MKKAGLFLLLLAIVGVLGFIAFPKSKDIKTSLNQIAMGRLDNVSTGQETNNERGPTVKDAGSLTLEITSPANNSTVNSAALQIIGKTSPNAEVFVNDQSGKADSTGNFLVNVSLDEGENTLSITVNDNEGNFAEKELTVNLQTAE